MSSSVVLDYDDHVISMASKCNRRQHPRDKYFVTDCIESSLQETGSQKN